MGCRWSRRGAGSGGSGLRFLGSLPGEPDDRRIVSEPTFLEVEDTVQRVPEDHIVGQRGGGCLLDQVDEAVDPEIFARGPATFDDTIGVEHHRVARAK